MNEKKEKLFAGMVGMIVRDVTEFYEIKTNIEELRFLAGIILSDPDINKRLKELID